MSAACPAARSARASRDADSPLVERWLTRTIIRLTPVHDTSCIEVTGDSTKTTVRVELVPMIAIDGELVSM